MLRGFRLSGLGNGSPRACLGLHKFSLSEDLKPVINWVLAPSLPIFTQPSSPEPGSDDRDPARERGVDADGFPSSEPVVLFWQSVPEPGRCDSFSVRYLRKALKIAGGSGDFEFDQGCGIEPDNSRYGTRPSGDRQAKE